MKTVAAEIPAPPTLAPRRYFTSEGSRQELAQQVTRSFFEDNGPVDDIIRLYNDWVKRVIKDQVASRQLILKDGSRIVFSVPDKVGDTDNPILPHRSEGGKNCLSSTLPKNVPLTPAEAIAQNLTYQFDLYVSATRVKSMEAASNFPRARGARTAKIAPETYTFKLGSIPAMVGSDFCWTQRLPKEEVSERGCFPLSAADRDRHKNGKRVEALLDKMGLDRSPLVSYFIIDGKPYVVLLNEKIRMNTFVTYFEKKSDRYVTSMKCSTNAGSLQVRVAFFRKGAKGTETAYIMELLSTATLRKRTKERLSGGMDYVKGGEGIEVLRASDVKESDQAPYVNVFHIFEIFGWPGAASGKKRDAPGDADDILDAVLTFVDGPFRERARGLLAPTFLEFKSGNEYPEGSLGFFRARFNVGGGRATATETIRSILRDDLFTQISPQTVKADATLSRDELERTDSLRMQMLAYMIAHHVMTVLGGLKPEDKNSWANNFLFSAGKVLEVHFGWLWGDVISRMQNQKELGPGTSLNSIAAQMTRGDPISQSYIHAFKTKKWDSFSRTTLATTLVEPLRDETYGSVVSQISVVNVKVHRRTRDRDLRQIQPSQAGYFCPAETPERGPCGLVKHRSLGCRLSVEDTATRAKVLKALQANLDQMWGSLMSERTTDALLMINGVIEGRCRGQEAVERLRFMRRRHDLIPKELRLAPDTLIVYTRDAFLQRYGRPALPSENILHVYSDGGRPLRPLFVVDRRDGELMMDVQEKQSHVDHWAEPFSQLLKTGRVEYVDAWEHEMNCYVAQGAWYMQEARLQLEEARKSLGQAEEKYEPFRSHRRGELEIGGFRRDLAIFLQRLRESQPILAEEYDRNAERVGQILGELEVERREPEKWVLEEELDQLEDRTLWLLGNSGLIEEDGAVRAVAEKARRLANLTERDVGGEGPATGEKLATQLRSVRSYAVDQSYAARYTHCEIHPLLLFGAAAASTVLPNNTYGPRTAFAAGQQKQAMGIYNTNAASRFDKAKVMVYPSLPIFGTLVEDLLRADLHPSGTTAVVAEVIFSGFTQEDAILANVTALQRGAFAYAKYSDYHTDFSATGMSYQWMNPSLKLVDGKPLVSPERCRAIDADGRPVIGRWVREDDVLIGKIKIVLIPGRPPEFEDASVKVKATDCGRIHSYMIAPGQNGGGIIKVRILAVREPIVGDKFTDRCGQKATIGKVLKESDMPRTARGIVPDLVVNPHAIPSRMTLNKLIEMIAAKRGALEGRRYDATAFQELDLEDFQRALVRRGFESMGTEEFYSGANGEPFLCRVYTGVAQYLRLKHDVMDKMQFRGLTGVFNAESKEPVGGTGKAGGAARLSELERQAMITHGASTVIRDRFCLSSNPFPVVVCAACSFIASKKQGTYRCLNPKCRSEGGFGRINMKYSQYRISGLLAGAMVDTQYSARPVGEEQVLDLFRKAGFGEPPPAIKALEDEGKHAGLKSEEITVGDIRVLLARKRPPKVGESSTWDGSYEVLAAIAKYNKLLANARDRRLLRDEVRRKIMQIGGFSYLAAPRRPTKSYFLQLYGPEPPHGQKSRLFDIRRSIFVTLRRTNNHVINTASLSEVWNGLREGKLTNPEEEMMGFGGQT